MGGTWVSCSLIPSQVDPQISVAATYNKIFCINNSNRLAYISRWLARRRELRKTRKARKWKNESSIHPFRVLRAFCSFKELKANKLVQLFTIIWGITLRKDQRPSACEVLWTDLLVENCFRIFCPALDFARERQAFLNWFTVCKRNVIERGPISIFIGNAP